MFQVSEVVDSPCCPRVAKILLRTYPNQRVDLTEGADLVLVEAEQRHLESPLACTRMVLILVSDVEAAGVFAMAAGGLLRWVEVALQASPFVQSGAPVVKELIFGKHSRLVTFSQVQQACWVEHERAKAMDWKQQQLSQLSVQS